MNRPLKHVLDLKTARDICDYANDERDKNTPVDHVIHNGELFELRVCENGEYAYLQWADEFGNPKGEIFHEISSFKQARTDFVGYLTHNEGHHM